MIESALVTILPVGFLIILFGGGALFSRRNIMQDGKAPINRLLFYASKYSILVLWGAMVIRSWGAGISVVEVPPVIRIIALCLWGIGFLFMYAGRFTMGDSFRLGSPEEDTLLKTGGLFRLTRNPMYVGMNATIAAASLYTLNPVVILLTVFVVTVHHRIVLAEENHLQHVFGREYSDYCTRVPRYV